MILGMMRTNNNIKKAFILIIIFLALKGASCFAKDWVIGAEAFSFPEKQNNAVTRGLSKTVPEKILEQLLQYSTREILSDETNQRKLYELKNQRTSLFLQLSAEIKKRDALVLSYSDKAYEKKLKEAENKIVDIQSQIDKNLTTQKAIIENTYIEPEIHTDFLSKKFQTEEESKVIEKIALYKNDSSSLYEVSQNNNAASKECSAFEKEIVSAGINGLLTGHINVYSQYITVTIELTVYPGAKTIAVLKEYGLVDEIDIIALSIVSELNNAITNSLPSVVTISGLPEDGKIYVDNKLLPDKTKSFSVDSGVHSFEFIAKDYKNAGTSYFFEGNQKYTIDVQMEELNPKTILLRTKTPVIGSFYANGIEGKIEEEKTVLSINGKSVLGQFISEDNTNSFFYISAQNLADEKVYDIPVNFQDTSDYIEKRRRWMYTSYSVLVTSLIPVFYCKGQVNSYVNANSLGYLTTDEDLAKANKWITASNVTTGISIGCGIWFAYELVRYLYAANKVLPVEVK